MTLANKITILRILAIPLFVLALIHHAQPLARWIFGISVLSDALDGALARKRGERTPLGTFLDPLADKLLLVSCFITYAYLGWIPVAIVVLLFSRDFLILSGWSLVSILTNDFKIQPRLWGKATTALQMAFAVALLFDFHPFILWPLFYAMIGATVISCVDYVYIGYQKLGAQT